MAIDFPASPTNGQTYVFNGVTYTYDGTKWTAETGSVSLDKIEEGNTSAEVIDTGSDGRFVVTTDGTQRFTVNGGYALLGAGNATATSTAGSYTEYTPLHIVGGIGTNNGGGIFIARNTPFTGLTNQDLGSIVWGTNEGAPFASIAAFMDGSPTTGSYPGYFSFRTTANGASSPTEALRIDKDGRAFLNTTTESGSNDSAFTIKANSGTPKSRCLALETNLTSGRIVATFRNPNGEVGNILLTGSSTQFNTSSDYRLKENVVPLTGAADRLKQIPVHRFNFITDPDTTFDGFLAHEAQAIVPECVSGTKDEVDAEGNPVYQGIDQSKLVPLITAALQEALHQIETQAGVITALNARITALEAN